MNLTGCTYFDPIKPSLCENVIKKSETDTLKVYITKEKNYYLTRIWVRNPYNQLKKYDSPKYGRELYKPKDLLEMAIENNNLSDKLIIGFNASGFYLRDEFDVKTVKKYPEYDKTSVGTIIMTEGVLVRNWYDKAYKTWFITGIDKNNKLRVFTDLKAKTLAEINDKINWSNKVLKSGIKNTFTFAAPLIENGIRSKIITSMPSTAKEVNRQAICQINDNNFVIITGTELKRKDLINIMLKLKCETGVNLDGGGSIALLYKDGLNKSIETIIGNERDLTEVAYFTE